MVISAFIELIGLGPARRVSTCSLLDRLLTATTKISICPHMTSYLKHSEFPYQRPRSTTAEEGQEEQRFFSNNQTGFRGGFQKLCR